MNHTPPDQARPSNSSNSHPDSPNPAAPEPEPEPESPLDRLLQALQEHGCKTRRTGKTQYKSQCPVHQGDGDTLEIKEEETGILLMHCLHTDDDGEETCGNDAILDALGLTWKDLFLPSGPFRCSNNGPIQKPKTGKSRTTKKSKGSGHNFSLLAVKKIEEDLGPYTATYRYEGVNAKELPTTPKTPEEIRQELERLVAELDPIDLATVEITPTPDEDDEDAADLDSDPRVKIQITPNWDQVLTATLDAILPDPELFRRGSDLVSICKQTQDETKLTPKTTMRKVAGSLKIILLSDTLIGCALTRNVLFTRLQRRGKGKPKLVQVNPPGWLIGAVATSQHYPGMRVLRGVMECPFFRSDGSLVEQPGYDAATETLLVSSNCEFLPVPESPTQEDAWEAANRLFALTSDFPFPTFADRAAWLAGLLTPIARAAIDGPVPGLAVCGNKPGIGKGKLIEVIGLIATGRTVPTSNYPERLEEAQKVKVAIALDGPLLIHFDNLQDGTSYGNSAFDSALTSRVINDRILSSSKLTGEIPWQTCCFLSGNNLSPGKHAHRRWLVCNILTELEHPEERSDFTIADLSKYVEEHRAECVRDALTILRAHFLAGQPKDGWGRLGSFEAWDQWIRGAVWFATGEDCCSTLRKAADESPERLQKMALLEGWLELKDGAKGITVSKAIEHVIESPGWYLTLHNALIEFGSDGKLATSRVIGNTIRGMNRTVIDDMRFEEAGEHRRAIKWRVEVLSQRKRDQLQKRKEQEALKQTVLAEEQLKHLSKIFLQADLSTELDAACTPDQV